MDPMTISAGLQGISALAGLFQGRRKMTAAEQMAYEDARKKSAMADRMQNLAYGYDPERELRGSLGAAEASASRVLANSTGELNRRFMADGGNPSGDTAFTAMKRRTQDDVLNPLMQFAADERGRVTQKKMSMLMSAFGARDGGSPLALQAAGFGASQQGPGIGGSVSMLANALGQIPGWGTKTPVKTAGRGAGSPVKKNLAYAR